MSLSPGSRIGSYEIRATLGTGGMGEVYRAHDPRLGRDVALKVLKGDITEDQVRLERFLREARAVAALNHPNIVTIYSTEEDQGVRFLTMELVEGQTLDAFIPPGGQAVARFLELALPLADALTAAHQKQITHRDLKPGNVMVAADGRVKVLDFGLARIGVTGDDGHSIDATRGVLTHEGTIVGTMPYMSPEQVEGRPLDARSDLFSLGVMFHEMLTGSRPFQGSSSAALMSSILRDTPTSVAEQRRDLPDGLARLVSRCLEKRPDDRVQTARDVYNELRHIQKQIESGERRAAAASANGSLWIAVLPFSTRGADTDADTVAAGLTEDITAGLSRFGSLSVVAEQSARAFRTTTLDSRQVAERLGARYLVTGNVRRSSGTIRVGAHLIDTATNATLWTETYSRSLEGTDLFAVQDDVTDHIVATIADGNGVLIRSMIDSIRDVPLAEATTPQLILHVWAYQRRLKRDAHGPIRDAIEAHLAREENPTLLAFLSYAYANEYALWFEGRPDPLGRALRSARRAIELDPNHQQGWHALSVACFHSRDEAGLMEAGERAIRLNPRNAQIMAWFGNMLTNKGDYDRGCQLTERAMALNAAHPGYFHMSAFNRHFARREFADALKDARRVNVPDFYWSHLAIATACGHLGLIEEGRSALEQLHRIMPFVAERENLQRFLERWFWQPEMAALVLEGIDLLTRGSQGQLAPTSEFPRPPSSGSIPIDESLWIAVLPFSSRGGDPDAEAVAMGLTEDITSGLARFQHLSVVAQPSARAYKDTTLDARHVAKELHACYLITGNVRKSSGTLRVTATLIDAHNNSTLWTETYDRATAAADLFVLQDDVTDRIVGTVADHHGILFRTMAESVKNIPYDDCTIGQLILRSWSYQAQPTAESHLQSRAALEARLAKQEHAALHAYLAEIYIVEYSLGANARPDPIGRAMKAARRAIELDRNNQEGWVNLALACFFNRDAAGFVEAGERAIALNPRNATALAWIGNIFTHQGELDRGCALTERAMVLNASHPGWYHFAPFNRHFARGNFEEALRSARRVNIPHFFWMHMTIAAACGHLGRTQEGRQAIERLFALKPDLADENKRREYLERWYWPADLREALLEGLRRAAAAKA